MQPLRYRWRVCSRTALCHCLLACALANTHTPACVCPTALQDGEAELLSHCLELRSSKAGGGKGGAAGGQQELALTPIGVRWALPPLAPAATASQQEHPSVSSLLSESTLHESFPA